MDGQGQRSGTYFQDWTDVRFYAKMHRIRFPLGLCPRPRRGSLKRSPDPLALFKGPTSKGERKKGDEREGEKRREAEGRIAERRRGLPKHNTKSMPRKCWGSGPDPAGGAHSAPPDPLAVYKWVYF